MVEGCLRVLHLRSLAVLALRRMRGNWRLLSSVVVGTVLASTVLSATAIYADAIRDLGLDFALESRDREALNVRLTQSNIGVAGGSYDASRARMESVVESSLSGAVTSVVRQGNSATFFPTAPGVPVNDGDLSRPRANLRFRSGLDEHILVVAGEAAQMVPARMGTDMPLPALVGAETAARNGIVVGDVFELYPFWDEDSPPLEVQVVGLAEPRDLDEEYWGGDRNVIDDPVRTWETYVFLVPEETFFGATSERITSMRAFYSDRYAVDFDGLNARNAAAVAAGVAALERRLAVNEQRVSVASDLPGVLREFDDRLFFVRIPLFVLLLQVGGIVAYYLVMVSTMLVERQSSEIATMRSRGASTRQLLAQYGVEGLLLAVVAALAGPPIAAAAISALGPTPAFDALSGGGPLEVHISGLAYLLAGAGALLAFFAFLIPAWLATRSSVVEFKRAAARPRPTPLLLRYYVDVVLVLGLAAVFWRLRQEDALFEETVFGDTTADPVLMATPAVVMVTVGLVFVRLFPLVLRAAAVVTSRLPSAAALVSIRSLARTPTHYSRLILMLMFATGVGLFGATFSATLDRSYEDRAAYTVGADIRVSDLRALGSRGDVVFTATFEDIPAQSSSTVTRLAAAVQSNGLTVPVELVGIDGQTFADVSYFRGDFADEGLDAIAQTLAEDGPRAEYVPLTADAQRLGVWVKAADIRGLFSFGYTYADASGRIGDAFLGVVRPGDLATEDWQFFSADLSQPTTQFSGRPIPVVPEPPLRILSVFFTTRSAIGAQRGVVLLGPVLTSRTPESAPPGPSTIGSEAFSDAEVAYNLAPPAWEVSQGTRSEPLDDRLQVVDDAPPGFDTATRYEWLDAGFAPRRRGVRQAIDDEPGLVYLSEDAADSLGLAEGDALQLTAFGSFHDFRLAGTFELFPTFDPRSGRAGFAVVNGPRLLERTNASLPASYLGPNEQWFASDDPTATVAALEELEDTAHPRVEDYDSELLRQEDDPLIGAGWEGILAISFVAVLLLSAIGFMVYSYLTSHERALEFAILRTLGFSKGQVFAAVLIEHLFVIVAGIGLGTLVGLQVGFLMMDLFEIDEQGLEVLPPFALGISWPQVFFVWGVLALVFVVTLAIVVLRYSRLALHRVLRVGDP